MLKLETMLVSLVILKADCLHVVSMHQSTVHRTLALGDQEVRMSEVRFGFGTTWSAVSSGADDPIYLGCSTCPKPSRIMHRQDLLCARPFL